MQGSLQGRLDSLVCSRSSPYGSASWRARQWSQQVVGARSLFGWASSHLQDDGQGAVIKWLLWLLGPAG